MGIFSGLFGSTNKNDGENKTRVPWIPLESLEQLEEIEINSKGLPQVIFKHSTTCGISRMVLNMFTASYALEEGKTDLYFLDLHAHRTISNAVAEKFQVIHQSPQLLIVKDGAVVAHESHGAISELELENYV